MNPVQWAIANPVKIAVGVILLLLSGMLSLTRIPVQLTPDVDQPVITISTQWPEGSPVEIEREILELQEEVLTGIKGLQQMTATANQGSAEIELELAVGTNMSRVLQEVSDALREVPDYPADAEEPVVELADGAITAPVAWLVLSSTDKNRDMQAFFDDADDFVKPMLERVPGVGSVDIFGGREQQVHVQVDPVRLAQRGVTYDRLAQALRGQNISQTAGRFDEGRLEAQTRAVGKFAETYDIEQTVIAYDDDGPIRVQDVATVELTLQKRRGFVRLKGESALAIRVIRESGANVMETMSGIRDAIDDLNERVLPDLTGKDPDFGPVNLRIAYDQTVYIDDAIGLVMSNLIVGGLLAVMTLLIFLESSRRPRLVLIAAPLLAILLGVYLVAGPGTARNIAAFTALGVVLVTVWISRPTGIIAIAIPSSVIGTFLVMVATGRNINVVSLAGLAFAVGMVVDAAIVVLENIDRHLAMGKPPRRAAFDGASEVWGAVLASTLTTAAVFLPVVFMEEEAGQLFRDIAIAIIASVLLSMVISITVIPAAAAVFIRPSTSGKTPTPNATADPTTAPSSPALITGLSKANAAFSRRLGRLLGKPAWRPARRLATVAAVVLFVAGVAILVTHAGDLTALKQSLFDSATPLGSHERLAIGALAMMALGLMLLPARLAIVGGVTGGALMLSWMLMPPTSYLPNGNQNLVFGIMLNPPGYSTEFQENEVAIPVEDRLRPYWELEPDDFADLPPVINFMQAEPGPIENIPGIEELFIVSRDGSMFMGGRSSDPTNVQPMGQLVSAVMSSTVPGTFGFAAQASIFGRDLGGSNSIEVQLISGNLEALNASASALFAQLMGDPDYGPGRVQPSPINFNLAGPELTIRIDREKAGNLGVDLEAVSLGLRTLIDGAIVGDFRQDGDSIDLVIIRDPSIPISRDAIAQSPLAIIDPVSGETRTIPLGSIVNFELADAPQQIRRIERQRAVTLNVQTPPGVPLESAERDLQERIDALRASGQITPEVRAQLAGTANKLSQVRNALLGEWTGFNLASLLSLGTSRLFLALLVVYLLMAGLFESFIYPLVILFTVPLATVGGFAGLAVVHHFNPSQQLDVLTMLGFVILIGIVVNNAILIVHQTLNFMRGLGDGGAAEPGDDTRGRALPALEAIQRSVHTRVRPILMTTLTSVTGMLPLVLAPGAGSELYRGLGSVVVGGLLTSALFTLLIIPVLLSLIIGKRPTGLAPINPEHHAA